MSFSPSNEEQARKLFNESSMELEKALAKYQKAKAELSKFSGAFEGTHAGLVSKFSQLMRGGDAGGVQLAEF